MFPIFLGFKTAGAIEQARAVLLRAEAQRDGLRRQVELEVAQARGEVERARALLAARRETVRQALRAQYLAGVRYTNGMATQLDVSDARVAAQQSEVNEVQVSMECTSYAEVPECFVRSREDAVLSDPKIGSNADAGLFLFVLVHSSPHGMWAVFKTT